VTDLQQGDVDLLEVPAGRLGAQRRQPPARVVKQVLLERNHVLIGIDPELHRLQPGGVQRVLAPDAVKRVLGRQWTSIRGASTMRVCQSTPPNM